MFDPTRGRALSRSSMPGLATGLASLCYFRPRNFARHFPIRVAGDSYGRFSVELHSSLLHLRTRIVQLCRHIPQIHSKRSPEFPGYTHPRPIYTFCRTPLLTTYTQNHRNNGLPNPPWSQAGAPEVTERHCHSLLSPYRRHSRQEGWFQGCLPRRASRQRPARHSQGQP